jgi:hypothetical protein
MEDFQRPIIINLCSYYLCAFHKIKEILYYRSPSSQFYPGGMRLDPRLDQDPDKVSWWDSNRHESSYFNKSRKMIRICRSGEHEWGELEGGSPLTRKCWVSNGDLERFETYSRHRSDDLEEVGEHMARNTCGDRIGLSVRSKPRFPLPEAPPPHRSNNV